MENEGVQDDIYCGKLICGCFWDEENDKKFWNKKSGIITFTIGNWKGFNHTWVNLVEYGNR